MGRTQRSMKWPGTIRRSPTMGTCSCSSSRLKPVSRPGTDFSARRHQRTVDVYPLSSMVAKAQVGAMAKWREQVGERWSELKTIQQPTLVVNGSHDIMVPTINSYILQQHIPNAQLVIYPDSGHGALFQYPELFVSHVSRFLDSEPAFRSPARRQAVAPESGDEPIGR